MKRILLLVFAIFTFGCKIKKNTETESVVIIEEKKEEIEVPKKRINFGADLPKGFSVTEENVFEATILSTKAKFDFAPVYFSPSEKSHVSYYAGTNKCFIVVGMIDSVVVRNGQNEFWCCVKADGYSSGWMLSGDIEFPNDEIRPSKVKGLKSDSLLIERKLGEKTSINYITTDDTLFGWNMSKSGFVYTDRPGTYFCDRKNNKVEFLTDTVVDDDDRFWGACSDDLVYFTAVAPNAGGLDGVDVYRKENLKTPWVTGEVSRNYKFDGHKILLSRTIERVDRFGKDVADKLREEGKAPADIIEWVEKNGGYEVIENYWYDLDSLTEKSTGKYEYIKLQ